ncbi:uncharacterized protein CLUP02_12510 [Colletotrichum lupini]|uniref:Uncharacterized protein n=1 Tax=Colletotrichum lupini TaxID=145971 RepID=A0A9Q8WKI4_9PEZI|nr:uncharacterized protein CLUP02_12510 [Colletotrichum lupini]UQC87008.1 hypothetical protein CLUP02_12510 [Colletotrichum lupini]
MTFPTYFIRVFCSRFVKLRGIFCMYRYESLDFGPLVSMRPGDLPAHGSVIYRSKRQKPTSVLTAGRFEIITSFLKRSHQLFAESLSNQATHEEEEIVLTSNFTVQTPGHRHVRALVVIILSSSRILQRVSRHCPTIKRHTWVIYTSQRRYLDPAVGVLEKDHAPATSRPRRGRPIKTTCLPRMTPHDWNFSTPQPNTTVPNRRWEIVISMSTAFLPPYSLVVTDPTTNPALIGLSMGERTGSRVFQWVWSRSNMSLPLLHHPVHIYRELTCRGCVATARVDKSAASVWFQGMFDPLLYSPAREEEDSASSAMNSPTTTRHDFKLHHHQLD